MKTNIQKQCPKYSSTSVAYILYVLPAFSDEQGIKLVGPTDSLAHTLGVIE